MPYLNLLRELAQKWDVNLNSYNGVWEVNLSYPHAEGVKHGAQGATPEEAIRKIYLLMNPIKRNTLDGKLTQT